MQVLSDGTSECDYAFSVSSYTENSTSLSYIHLESHELLRLQQIKT